MDAILTEGAVLERELGKTDVVKLSWNSDCKKTLPVGSYIVPFDDGLKYRLLDDYTPSEGSTSLKYEPVFNHPLAILSRNPFLYGTTDQDGNPIKQQEWSYDGLTTNALEYACKAINEALGITDESKKFTYTLCGTVDPTISFSVSSNDILSVLSSMAQACKDNSSEWHLSWEDHTLYFGQIFINLGEKIPLLKVHDNINFASVNSSNEPYYNCFYPQGSSRNMSRKAQVGLGNVATLVRLGLNKNKFPDGCIYVDKDSNVITKEDFEQSGAVKQMVALSFDDVYPHIDLYAYNVRPRYRYLKNKQTNEIEKDANGKNKVYTTWYMRLAYPTTVKDDTKTLVNTTNDIDEHGKQVTHYWYDYELNVKEQVLQGHTLKATFKVNTHATDGKYDALTQSLVGQPNGQDGFELAYFDKNDAKEIPSNQKDGDSGINIKAGDYEIMFYQSGDVIIPTNTEEGLFPRGNNLPDLTCNIVVLFNIKQGQQEIASAQEELAKRTEKEIERRFKDNNNYSFSSNPVAFEENNPNLHIGQKVIFNDGQGYELSTRIIKIESKIDFPFIQSITVGNQAVKGAITQLKEDVKSILSGNFSGGGGLNASQIENVIKNFTLPRFLRKDVADEAKGHITFWRGLTALVKSFFNGIENNGNFRNKGDITNSGNIMTKNLTVTDKATFFELEIQKAKAAGGMSVNSAGSFHIDAVEETIDGYVCYQRAEQDGVMLLQTCEPKDQMMCSNGMNILKGGKGNHYYWRLATKAPKEVVMHTIDGKEEKCLKIVLSKTDRQKAENESPQDIGDIPKVGDDLVQIGNRDNKERQSVIMTCAYNSFDGDLKAPYWVQYDGVNDYKLSTHKRTWFAANGSQVTGNFKVQSDNGGLESIEDYMKSLASENSSVLYKLVMSSSQFNVKADGSFTPQFIYINAYKVQGENLTPLSPSENVKVYVSKGENELGIKGYLSTMGRWNLWVEKEDLDDVLNVDLYVKGKLADKQKIHVVRDGQDGRNGRDGQKGKDGINGENGTDGKDGKDAVSYNLIPMQEAAVAYKADSGKKLVRLFLAYKIQKKVGEVTRELALGEEGIKLSVTGITETFKSIDGAYVLDKKDVEYKETNIDTYIVTLKKGSDIVDQRIVPITFKPKVVFDIDTKNGEIRSDITNVKGDVNSFRATIKKTKATVGNLQKEFTQLQMTSKEISLTVNNGTRPNLLWGSDLDLSGVQDKIKLAYHNGDVIQQNTAKKEELQQQLDATPTNDTAKRNDLQDKINACDKGINTARNKVSECKVAIEKHLGVGLNATRVDSIEWFEYLKGGGVGGADAIKAKVAAVNGEGNYYAGLYWQTGFGAKHHIKVKPNTKYTYSFWLKTEILQGSGYVVVESFNMESLNGGRKGRTMPWTSVPVKNKWERMSYTFTTGDTGYIMVGVGLSGEDDFSGLIYLCRPKLEEGNTATPWCAYDGTVEALIASGFSLKDKDFTATSDNFKVRNNKGEWTFLVDENGHINAKLISAESISAQKIAQPFVEQESFGMLMTSPSLSWYITKGDNINNRYILASELNGAVLNIYNHTADTIKFYSTLAVGKKTYFIKTVNVLVEIEPGAMFRAFGVPIKGMKMITDNGTTTLVALVPLVPMELTKLDGDIRANYIGAVKGFLTIK
ncbi:hypothetical protein HMPREF2137_12470 [Hoylesella buccalis DNF00853]|uniref:CBM-cenC domain-containing protein n=2 Tax=Hoylesella buccalis TaxID=28127 RepID=A0A095ZDW0_9BACT|nr:hypothetical protein HMPREF2137_12470 [Hoylesella buccalis DNF00853]